MYAIKVSYGYADEPETATVEILGIYGSLDEACEAAESKFDATMERIDDVDIRFRTIKESRYDYYVTYGYVEPELGSVFDEFYYEVSVIER